jgi:hypothetical protein
MNDMPSRPLFEKGWEVTGIRSAQDFFSGLTGLLPLPVRFCFEGAGISSDIEALFAASAVSPILQIPRGTIWPKPKQFHVLATEQFVRELADLTAKHVQPEICDHFHAYNDNHGLMQWYDAFDLPLLVHESVTEANLQPFCNELKAKFGPWRAK